MCEFCTKHGEGKAWYLKAENYSNDLLADIRRRKLTEDFFNWTDRSYRRYRRFSEGIVPRLPFLRPIARYALKRAFIDRHWGQVVPIEDIERMLNIANSIVRVPCVCRKITTGKEVRSCFLFSSDPDTMGAAGMMDKSFFGGPDVARFEKVDRAWAIDFARRCESEGMVHTTWTLGSPFIGGICNCDLSSGCISMKMFDDGFPIMFKGEYVARIDEKRCSGCGRCVRMCQFKAIELDRVKRTAAADPERCYGCGVCRTACGGDAIALVDRAARRPGCEIHV